MRFRLLAHGPVKYSDCLIATAWYALLLIGLPARLGEVAGVAVIVRYMHQRTGTAAVSLLFQRLFDVIVLGVLLVVVCVLAFVGEGVLAVFVLSAMVIAALIALMIYLEELLAIAVRPLLGRREEKWPRRILRVALQARMFRRHHMDRARILKLGGYTLCKWLATLTAIGCIVVAVAPALSPFTALGIGIVYNLSAVIPIQTVGGFGVGEAVLLGSFSWLGYSLEVGAPIAIAIRLVLISAPILFWLAVMLVTVLPKSASSNNEQSNA
jgi:uncharacterized membrane protein YbhN (UPF0104 family)